MAESTNANQGSQATVTFVVHGRSFTFRNRCTHFPQCDLTKGTVDGSTVTCVCGWQYDLLTGRALNHPLAQLERM